MKNQLMINIPNAIHSSAPISVVTVTMIQHLNFCRLLTKVTLIFLVIIGSLNSVVEEA